ncbi:MAG: DUF4350 domain-containing protein [Flavobacteriales bacterium]|nr:DUF4350 domain-containing protein [Flavobacteriales bacterium]MCX7767734.1 DUF4350 domain-containing protein [Flavobacteriales bacterium]MDW8409371.1 DUF4350 domain-containing protein [Flavobacteriales bacterium]
MRSPGIVNVIAILAFLVTGLLLKGQTVIVDLSHGQPFFPLDPGFAGQRQFLLRMLREGYRPELSFKSLARLRRPLMRRARQGCTLLVLPTVFRNYSALEIRLMRDFVKAGGRLVLVAEHDNFFNHAVALNQLLHSYGVSIKDTAVKKYGDNSVAAGWLNANWIERLDQSVRLYLPACLNVHSRPGIRVDTLLFWKPWAEARPLALSVEIKAEGEKGRVAVLTDFEIFWNMSGGEGVSYGLNGQFLMRLLGQTPSHQQPFVPSAKRPKPLLVSEEDSLILYGFFKELWFSRPGRKYRLCLTGNYPRLVTFLTTDTTQSSHPWWCHCGPQTLFVEAMHAQALQLAKRYPGIDMDKRIRQMYERLSLNYPEKGLPSVNTPVLLTGPRLNEVAISLKNIPDSSYYVAAYPCHDVKEAIIETERPYFARYYPAPLIPLQEALADSVSLLHSSGALVAGFCGKNFYWGLAVSLADNLTSPPRKLKKLYFRSLHKWYGICTSPLKTPRN